MVLGDIIFYGAGLQQKLSDSVEKVKNDKKAVVFGYYVEDLERYGVAEFDQYGNVLSIEEKPIEPKSNYAVVGLYFYTNNVVDVVNGLTPSARGELEITSVNQHYVTESNLNLQLLSRGFAWLDTGTHEVLTDATEFVKALEKRTGLKIACIEEIAFRMGWISKERIISNIKGMKGNYYNYLANVLK